MRITNDESERAAAYVLRFHHNIDARLAGELSEDAFHLVQRTAWREVLSSDSLTAAVVSALRTAHEARS